MKLPQEGVGWNTCERRCRLKSSTTEFKLRELVAARVATGIVDRSLGHAGGLAASEGDELLGQSHNSSVCGRGTRLWCLGESVSNSRQCVNGSATTSRAGTPVV